MIQVDALRKSFGEVEAVDGISFDVTAGEIFAFLGPNGAGKTTTIQMLTTLLTPTSGSIASRRHSIPLANPLEVRRRFGIVFQDPSLDGELTAYENMDLHGVLYHVPRRVRAERIEALLKLVRAVGAKELHVKTFSGGMKRRLEIARGLLHTPKILFLDEPTLGLDPQSRNQLWAHVQAPERDRGGDGVPDDALHGRGRARRAPHRDHRPRPDRRAGHAAGAEAADRHRFARRGVPRAHRHDDSRRARRRRRPDAADGRRCGGDDGWVRSTSCGCGK